MEEILSSRLILLWLRSIYLQERRKLLGYTQSLGKQPCLKLLYYLGCSNSILVNLILVNDFNQKVMFKFQCLKKMYNALFFATFLRKTQSAALSWMLTPRGSPLNTGSHCMTVKAYGFKKVPNNINLFSCVLLFF